jgi:hypothetical protein
MPIPVSTYEHDCHSVHYGLGVAVAYSKVHWVGVVAWPML